MNSNLPPNWSYVKLGDVATVLDNKRIPINSTERQKRILGKSKEELYPYYGATGQVDYIDGYLLEGEYVLLGEDGAPFLERNKTKAYIVNGKFWVNNHAHILLSKYDNKFLCYYLNFIDYHPFVTGTTRLKLNQTSMKNIPIVNPSLPEQKKIVAKIEELFSELDNGIEQLKKAKEQLKTYRQAVLKFAFEGKLTNSNREDLSISEVAYLNGVQEDTDLLPYKQAPKAAEPKVKYGNKQSFPDLPTEASAKASWKWAKLRNIAEIKRGKSKHRPRNDPKLYGGDYPFIQTGEIREANGGTIRTFKQTYNETGLAQSKLWPRDTLCISIAANIGETAFLGFDACFPDSIVGIIPDKKTLDGKFINYYFMKEKEKISELAPATAQKNINVAILQKLDVPLPNIIQQKFIVQEIESRFSVADKLEETIDESLSKAEMLRQSILKQAFEGKLVPQIKEKVLTPFQIMQIVGAIIKNLDEYKIRKGEMIIAKYLYLLEKLYGIKVGFNYKQWHFGPYSAELKKILYSKNGFIIKTGNGNMSYFSIIKHQSLFKYHNSLVDEVNKNFPELIELFDKYKDAKTKDLKVELLATVCKVVEDNKELNSEIVYKKMSEWETDKDITGHSNKAEKFNKAETERCIKFILKQGWDKKLIGN